MSKSRAMFDALDATIAAGSDILLLRDRAMFAVMLFGFVRVSALQDGGAGFRG